MIPDNAPSHATASTATATASTTSHDPTTHPVQHGQSIGRDLVLLVLALGCVGLYVLTAGGGFPLDDSWIHQVYGRNLAQTGQWAFVPDVPSAASTSPLYTVLLAVGYALGLPYTLWTHLIGALALGGMAMLAARLAELLWAVFYPAGRTGAKWRGRVGLATGTAVVLTWQLIWAGAAGMETPLFAMLTLAVMWLALCLTVPTAITGAIFGVVGALCILARPEGALIVGLAGLAVVIAHHGTRNARLRWMALMRWVIGGAVGGLITLAPYLALNLSLTGGLLPNTAGAKFAQHLPLLAQPYPVRLADMLLPLLVGGQVMLIPGAVFYLISAGRRWNRRTMLHLLPVLWCFGLVALYAARLPASYQHGRYVLPALPSLMLVGVVGAAMLLHTVRANLFGRVFSRALAAAAGLLLLVFALTLGLSAYQRDVTIINQEMVAAAHWIDANIPPDELLAIHDIGAVGYFTPRPMLDIAGLLTPDIVPLIGKPDALWAYMEQHGARYLMAFPDQIPGNDRDDPRLCEVFNTGGRASIAAGGGNMAVYRLDWSGGC